MLSILRKKTHFKFGSLDHFFFSPCQQACIIILLKGANLSFNFGNKSRQHSLYYTVSQHQRQAKQQPKKPKPKLTKNMQQNRQKKPIKQKKSGKHNHILDTLGSQSFCLNSVCLSNYIACYLPTMFFFQLECSADDLMLLMSSFLGGERRKETLLPNSDLRGWLSGECTRLIVLFLSCSGCNCIYKACVLLALLF